MSNTLVTGGNVIPADSKRLGYAFIIRTGNSAKRTMRFLKLAQQQGITITGGSYKYSGFWSTPRFEALNLEFVGPRDAIDSLEAFISAKTGW